MSSPWAPPHVREGDAGDARPVTFADLALPAVIGGVLPLTLNWCTACMGLTVLSFPVVLIATIVGGALAGANVSRRRSGPLGAWAITRVAALLAAIQTLPCAPVIGMLGVGAATSDDTGSEIGFTMGLIIGVVVVAAGILALAGAGGALLGHAAAQGGTLGPAWTGPAAGPPAQGQVRAAGALLAAIVGVTIAFVVLCTGIVWLAQLGEELDSTFEEVGGQVE